MEKETAVELYNNLKEESRYYISHVQTLTIMKFIAISAIISLFIVNKEFNFESALNKIFLVIGIGLIPFVSFYLDLKVLEMTLHARSISQFIEQHYSENSILTKWEKYIWSKDNFLPYERSRITFYTSVGSSFAILISVWAFISFFIKIGFVLSLVIGVLVILIILFGSWFSYKYYLKIWTSN